MNDPENLNTSALSQNTKSNASESSGSYNGQPDDLHDLFTANASGDVGEDDPLAELRNDPNYAALIRDLEYIAKQARLLFEPAQEAPSEDVWKKIKDQLDTNLEKG